MPEEQAIKQRAKIVEVSAVYEEKGKTFQILLEELLKTMLPKSR